MCHLRLFFCGDGELNLVENSRSLYSYEVDPWGEKSKNQVPSRKKTCGLEERETRCKKWPSNLSYIVIFV